MELTREQALALLRQYNEEPFHLRHALTVEAVMNWFANWMRCRSLCYVYTDLDYGI